MKRIVILLFLCFNPWAFGEGGAADEFADEYQESKQSYLSDPLSGYNRYMTGVNDALYLKVFSPLARQYAYAVPEKGRIAVYNFFENLMFPIRFANNLLQLKIDNAFEEVGSFGINTTAGLFGLFDTAKERYGIGRNNEDLGQTLGYYGIGSGFHVVLPVLGPSNVRDIVGMVGDSFIDPTAYAEHSAIAIPNSEGEELLLKFYKQTNAISLHLGEYENLRQDAIDLYPFLRDIYEQRRDKLIKE